MRYRNVDIRILRIVNTFGSIPNLEYVNSLGFAIHHFGQPSGIQKNQSANGEETLLIDNPLEMQQYDPDNIVEIFIEEEELSPPFQI